MSDGQSFSVGEILAATFALLRSHAAGAALALILLAAGGYAIDSGLVGIEFGNLLNFILSLFTLAFQYWLTRAVLRDAGAQPAASRYISLFVMNLLSVLAIFVGLALLIVPGIVLFVRWAIAVPILLDSDEGVTDSLAASWRATEGHFVPIFLVLLAVQGPGVTLAVGTAALAIFYEGGPAAFVAANLFLYATLIAGWFASAAIYLRLRAPSTLGQVFE